MTSTNEEVNSSRVALWLGCYTGDMEGHGEGIVALGRGDHGYVPLGPATPIPSPSFLAQHPSLPVIYAVSEGAQQVHALRHDGEGTLSPLGEAGAAGALVCHVAVAPGGDFLVASCWGDGAVLAFELEADGSLGRRHVGAASQDPYGDDRQSRAHSCLMLGDGYLLTADMGHDLVRFWRFSADGGLDPRGAVTLPQGSGPRHFARGPAGIVYVNTEHSVEVGMLTPVATAAPEERGPWLELSSMYPAAATGVRAGDAAAEICLDDAAQNLYISVRGSNRICRLALDAEGVPTPLEEFGCGGDWPRHHCFDGERLLVALQRSDAVAVFEPGADGYVTRPPQLLASGSPTCLLPAR